ncbi:ASCH domain-containing protein [Streptomyces misionensis]|uniref:ASCH domain-containing protein n=1 Tax=Streptomyces misionensis TaxID=67331 RepID=A0A5C6JRF8_9ACTN|nr:ASCH domain-containing protein [Streptomyces misionensis]TWV43447.1 ASCH domain-containing protein [Streptomyces misionensis]
MTADDLPTLALAFPGPERDRGVEAVISGRKTAMTALAEILERAGEPVPQAGRRYAVLDSDDRPAVVIELTEVRVIPFREVDDRFARDEGRGYADAEEWAAAHRDFFSSEPMTELLGYTPAVDDDALVVAERFRVVDPGTDTPASGRH